MYGWDLCPGTATMAEKAYKELRKLANQAMVTHKPGWHPICDQLLAQSNAGLSRVDFMGTNNAQK